MELVSIETNKQMILLNRLDNENIAKNNLHLEKKEKEKVAKERKQNEEYAELKRLEAAKERADNDKRKIMIGNMRQEDSSVTKKLNYACDVLETFDGNIFLVYVHSTKNVQ